MLQIRNKIAVIWKQNEYERSNFLYKRSHLIRNFNNKKTYTGMITASTAKRIRQAVDMLLQVSPSKKITNPYTKAVITHRLTFITLTISDNIRMYTPQEGYNKLLKPFLRILREKQLINTYIWKAEFQERGQLHYHITTNSVIDLRLIRKYWNALQMKNKMLNEYYLIHNHYDPNSTDIHTVYKLRDIQAYLVKYLSKNTQNQTETQGKIWDASDNLKGKKNMSFKLNQHNIRKIVEETDKGNLQLIELSQCAIIKSKTLHPSILLDVKQRQDYYSYLQSIQDKGTKANTTASPT